eukprot:Opistho-2@42850
MSVTHSNGDGGDAQAALRSASRAAYLNMGLQLGLRILTFVMNAFVLRHVSRELLGTVNVRLTLLWSSILFLSRESLRKACLGDEFRNKQSVRNTVWLAVPIGACVSVALFLVWTALLVDPGVDGYTTAAAAFALAAVVELAAEPLYVHSQWNMHVGVKVCAEGVAMVVRCVVVAIAVTQFPGNGLTGFAIAQLAYAVGVVGAYYGHYALRIRGGQEPLLASVASLLPRRPPDAESFAESSLSAPLIPQAPEAPRSPRDSFRGPQVTYRRPMGADSWRSRAGEGGLFNVRALSLAAVFFRQGVLKQLLTEGERYIMTVFAVIGMGEQGTYDIVNNLGSLVPRFVFQPIEESFYVFFTRVIKREDGLGALQPKDRLDLAASTYATLLRTMLTVGLVIACFGQAYSPLLLRMYGGSALATDAAVNILRWYCVYVLVMSLNGVAECFYHAVAPKSALEVYNRVMVAVSAVLLVASIYLVDWMGASGFVAANCIAMGLRGTYCFTYTRLYFIGTPHADLLRHCLPSSHIIAALALSAALTLASRVPIEAVLGAGLLGSAGHVGVGLLCLSGTVLVALATDHAFVSNAVNLFVSRGAAITVSEKTE